MLARSLILLLALVACSPFPDAHLHGSSANSSEVDTGNQLDPMLLEQIEAGERFEFWMELMELYVVANPDQTYTFDQEAFLQVVESTHPEVVAHYERNAPETPDTVTIDGLIEGIMIVNQFVESGSSSSAANAAPPPSVYSGWYWWGYQRCYTGSDSDAMIARMTLGSATLSLSGIGTIPGGVLALYTSIASYYDTYYGGFCLNVQWNTQVTVNRP